MLPRTSQASGTSFFTRLLTSRQFLTRWSPGLLVLVAAFVWLISPWGFDPAGLSSPTSQADDANREGREVPPGREQENTIPGESNGRLLLVNTRAVGDAGPPEIRHEYTGIVVPRRTSQLAAKALGRVDEVLVDIGDRVQAGQKLVRLDQEQLNAELKVAQANLAIAKNTLDELVAGPRRQDIESAQARVAELKANFRLAESNLNRRRGLRSTAAISQQELEEAETQVEATRKQLESARQQLALLEEGTRAEQIAAQRSQVASLEAAIDQVQVRLKEQEVASPYSGHVQQRFVDEGEVVSPGQVLLELVESTALEVRVGIPPGQVRRDLQPSDFEIVSREGPEPTSLPAQFERMSPAIDATTRTRQYVFTLRESASELVEIGDAVSVSIRDSDALRNSTAAAENHSLQQGVRTGFWVPSDALSSGPRGLWIVYIASDNATLDGKLQDDTSPNNYLIDSKPPSTDKFESADHVRVVERRPVELLQTFGRWSKVRGPLRADEQLIVDGLHRVVQGQRVKIKMSDSGDTGIASQN